MFFLSIFTTLLFLLLPLLSFSQNYDKWIVVTTIQYPTQALEKLAKIDGWHLVVVADKKTPADWHLDNCDFLSVEMQDKLPYKIIQLLPWNHYSRKNIGYLYAIEHGASIIYETDDDNYLIDTIAYLPEHKQTLQYVTDAIAMNTYADFGQPLVWPRGFPLNHLNSASKYTLEFKETFIPIQQGLVNSDPDVDAIFRLTHAASEIAFDSGQEAISLPKQTMCPFNSQNTIFRYAAFWGLVLPITPKFRVCDIWRGYWVQRILWDMNASLCFLSASANQYRNEHNLIKDFEDEIDLYLQAESFIRSALAWNSQEITLKKRSISLMEHLIAQNYFKPLELDLLKAWFDDLNMIGYKMRG